MLIAIILGVITIFIIKAFKEVFKFMKVAIEMIWDELNDPDYFTAEG